MRRRLFALLSLGCVSAVLEAQMGAITRLQKIDDLEGGFGGALDPEGAFGYAQAALGDVNGDGVPDLAVSAPRDDDGAPNAGAIWIVFLDAGGQAIGQQKISALAGGFGGALSEGSNLGRKLAPLGDLDGNGVPDLAALAAGPHRLFVLLLEADGSVRDQVLVPFDAAPFPVGQPLDAFRKSALCFLGDLGADGTAELVVSAPYDDDGHINSGALWVLSLGADGHPAALRKISELAPDLGPVLGGNALLGLELGRLAGDASTVRFLAQTEALFANVFHEFVLDEQATVLERRTLDAYDITRLWPTPHGVASAGDLDGDGQPEVLLSYLYDEGRTALIHLAPLDDSGNGGRRALVAGDGQNGIDGFGAGSAGYSLVPLGDLDGDGTLEFSSGSPADVGGGALWILSMATSEVRNGSGLNPLVLKELAEPDLGQDWQLYVDAAGHAPGVVLLSVWERPAQGSFVSAGEVLVDLASTRYFQTAAAHGGSTVGFTVPVPSALSLRNRTLHVQALITGAPGPTLTSALGVVIGRP